MSLLSKTGSSSVVTACCLLAVWAGMQQIFDPRETLFPGPWTTGQVWWQERHVWSPHAWATGSLMIISLLAALASAVPMAYLMSVSARFRATVESVFLALQCLPLFIMTPILVAIAGWGWMTVLIPSFLSVLFPLCISLFKGVQNVPKSYLELFGTFRMESWSIFWTVQLPYSLPSLFAGLRMAIATAASSVLAAEFAGGQQGLGMLIQESRRNFDLPTAFASILTVVSLTGFCVGACVVAEKILLKGRRDATAH
jgi:NitT/TauT family transport system substrate-binding protein